jgi:AbrB family looped-hinge helix DNA binding protein
MLIDWKAMSVVTISPKYQVVIPKDVREKLKLTPGQKVRAMAHEGRIELIPIRPLKDLRGFLRGVDAEIEREADRV